ncbi:TadE/TadG family type IV pilus assembly protein [Dialister hominis]|jgi:hypothetical protein|uniref:TadE/TadG family type IV pilus assembly protein n=1 Tax=Dialister hominis TaxID=2582419 RepID=UPI00259A273D|nr:pilus assembly protein TadG-related protein [uncultured Dialister sp.]
MLSRILRGQKGAFLVLTAILVPVIFLFTCLAADLGKGWAYQSKLQNAADAAVLAGAYVYKVNQDQGNTRTRIKEYMNSNMGRDGYKIDRIRYRYKEGDPTKGTLISLYASAEVPTNFISIIGQDSMHVSVVSTAKVTPDGKGSSGIFDYAIYGGHKGRPHDMAWDNSYPWDQNALYFNHPYLHIKGKVHADGPIYLTNNVINGRRAFMVDPGNFTTSIANDRDLWSNFSDNYWDHVNETEGQGLYTHDDWIRSPYSWAQGQYTWRHYMRLGFDDGTAAGRDVVASENYVAQSGARDISLSPSNSNTSGIYSLVEKYRNSSDESVYVRTDGHYSDTNRGGDGFNDYREYKVIIVDGDIAINPNNYQSQSDSDYMIIISLHGNVTIAPSGDKPLRALVYAPQGDVTLYAGAGLVGSIVAQSVQAQSDVTWKDFGFSGGSGSSGSSGAEGGVTLYKDDDSSYTDA